MKTEEKIELLQQLYDQLRCTHGFDVNSNHMVALQCTIFSLRHRMKVQKQIKDSLKTLPKWLTEW